MAKQKKNPALQTISITIEGLDEILDAVARFDKKTRNKIFRDSLRDGIKPIAKDAKTLAPRGATKKLYKSIRVRAAKRKRNRIAINAQIGKGNFKGKTFYGAIQEMGWTTSTGRKIAGKHFMKRAFIRKKKQAMEIIRQTMLKGIDKAVTESAAKAAQKNRLPQ